MEWLVNVIYYVVPFIVLLGILVFVHELGHFLVARFCGVKVEEFSIGFGKELWGRTDKKGTHWKIAAVPLGGYCRFLGDGDETSSTSGDVENLSDEDKKRAFPFQPTWKKLAIVLAGPGANYLFAILVFAAVFFFLGKVTLPPVIGEVIAGSSAEKAGLQVNDRILSVDGHEVKSFDEVSREIDMATAEKVNLKVKRGEKVFTLNVPLSVTELEAANGAKIKRKMMGVRSVSTVELNKEQISLPQAFVDAGAETWQITKLTLRGVGQMISGKRGTDDLGGIIRIAEMSGDISKQSGFIDFVIFMALLSINLGLINLFPIPLLDGGHVVIYVVEMVTRRELNEKIKDAMFKFGFGVLVFLMLFATWNDVLRLFHRWFS